MKKTAAKKKPAATKKSKPLFIVIEGGEGSGKSSLMIALKEALGDKIFTTREPGGSPYAEVIRNVTVKEPLAKGTPVETTLCLMFASRFENTARAIVPTLEAGIPVVADRFDASSYAYNVMAQSDGVLEDVFWGLREQLAALPDLYVFIDVSPEEGIRRASNRNQSLLHGAKYDHFDDREIAFHEKVRDGYLKFFKKVPHAIIDANRPFDEVKKDFIYLIKVKLGL
jgi:dTMP kinase